MPENSCSFEDLEAGAMKRTNQMSILLLMAYCIPFAYLCVMGDGKWGTMLFYGVMIAGFSLLCWGAVKTGRRTIIFIGNLCSLLSSCPWNM